MSNVGWFFLILCLLALAGCGGGGDESSDQPDWQPRSMISATEK